MAGQRRAASLTGSRRPRLGDAKPVAERAERVLQRTGQRLRAGYGLAERLLLVLDLIEKTIACPSSLCGLAECRIPRHWLMDASFCVHRAMTSL